MILIYILFVGCFVKLHIYIYILPFPPIPLKVDMQWDIRQFFDPNSTNSMAVGVSQA